MSKVGRNEPCPCKSGKKYKHCHGPIEQGALSESGRARRLHDLDRELVDRLLRFATHEFGEEWLGELLAQLDVDLDESMAQLVIPCSVYDWASEHGTILELFLESSPRGLSAEERAWLEAQRLSSLSIWEIEDVTQGVAVSGRDLFTGERRRVLEQAGSRTLSSRDGVLGRVVDFDGIAVFCGMHPRVLPPRFVATAVAALRKTLGFRSKRVPVARLRASVPLEGWIRTWEQVVEHHDVSMARVPKLQNTDGDSLLLTSDHFEFDPSHRPTIEAKLAALAEADDEPRSPAERSFTFQRPGNAMHKSWDNTIIGRAVLRERKLVLETNSVRRADALRATVEDGLGGLVRHRTREHQDPEAMLHAPRAKSTASEAGPQPPHLIEALRDFKRQHFESWLDTPIPALSGLTPREAAAKPRKRREVVLLLKEIENHEGRVPPHERFDVSSLWSALDLGEAGP